MRSLLTATLAMLVFTVVLGLGYPLVVTGLGQVVFGDRADGSRVERDGRVVGSRLIGQDFSERPDAFQSRPSVTEYSPSATFFNNRGPNQATLAVQQRRFVLDYLGREGRYNAGLTAARVPADAATTAASGVDPHISQDNARVQAARVAALRRLPRSRVDELVERHTDGRALGLMGEPGVNVLTLNLALDEEPRR